jgi:hypothetical protein
MQTVQPSLQNPGHVLTIEQLDKFTQNPRQPVEAGTKGS